MWVEERIRVGEKTVIDPCMQVYRGEKEERGNLKEDAPRGHRERERAREREREREREKEGGKIYLSS